MHVMHVKMGEVSLFKSEIPLILLYYVDDWISQARHRSVSSERLVKYTVAQAFSVRLSRPPLLGLLCVECKDELG